MHSARLFAAAAVLLAAAPALAQPSVTPPPADTTAAVEGDVTVTVGATQGSDTDVAPAEEKPAPPTRTASAAPSMVEPVEVIAPPPAPSPAVSYVEHDT